MGSARLPRAGGHAPRHRVGRGLAASALAVLLAAPQARAQTAWRWTAVPGTELASVPGADPQVMSAWGGGAWDSRERRLLIWGGGHGDSYDNALYYLDPVNGRAGRLSPRSPKPKDPQGIEWPKNRCVRKYALMHPDVAHVGEVPVSRHTYDLVEYLPGRHWFLAVGGSQACGSGGFAADTWVFDLERGVWRDMEPGGARLRPSRLLTVWDPAAQALVAYDGGRVLAYSLARNEWRLLRRAARQSSLNATAALDPVRRLMVIVGTGGTRVVRLDGSRGFEVEPVATSGATDIERHYPGVDYHPDLDRLVAWGGSNSSKPDLALVYTLELGARAEGGWTGTWEAARTTGHPLHVGTGVNGKLRWAPELGAIVVATSAREPLYLLRPEPGGRGAGSPPALSRDARRD